MFYGDTIQETRQMYFSSWKKYQDKQLLSALEQQIANVIIEHPEYHQFIENPARYHEHSYYPEFGETNPFLHMGLHLGIREQVQTNRPEGIATVFNQLLLKTQDRLAAEHLMMDCLAECLWLSQKNNLAPDEQEYLNSLTKLCNK